MWMYIDDDEYEKAETIRSRQLPKISLSLV